MNDMGKQIRALRLHKNLTQEKLAEKLLLSPQAVSKWENGQALPDITLLPGLSAQLGVSIDELFEITTETHLERIQNMLDDTAPLNQAAVDDAQGFLENQLTNPAIRPQALSMLAQLYVHRAESLNGKAREYALMALEAAPACKANHTALGSAWRGILSDWCAANHREQIDYYKNFVRKHPDYRSGYLYLMDFLIADRRFQEARDTLGQMEKRHPGYLTAWYQGLIALAEGDKPSARVAWDKMLSEHPEEWLVQLCYGEGMIYLGEAESAVCHLEKAAALQPRPRYVDAYDSIAQLALIRGDKKAAIAAYEKALDILETEWQMADTQMAQDIRQKMLSLR